MSAADSHPQDLAPHISHPGGFRHRNRIPAKTPVPESSTGGRAQALGRRFEAIRPCWATSLKPELSGPPCPSPGADKGRFFPLSAEVELCAGRLEGCRHGRFESAPQRLRPGKCRKKLVVPSITLQPCYFLSWHSGLKRQITGATRFLELPHTFSPDSSAPARG